METSEQQGFELKKAIERSTELSDFLHRALGEKADLTARGRLAMAYLSIALDHREAILLLVSCGAYTSATALHRPLLEAVMSGAWVESSATDTDVEGIATFKRPQPKAVTMIKGLRKTHELGKWFEVLYEHYGIVGDYTHGNVRQLSRWLGRDAIEPQFSDGQIIELLRHTNIVGLLAAILREKLADRPVTQLFEMLAMLTNTYRSHPAGVSTE